VNEQALRIGIEFMEKWAKQFPAQSPLTADEWKELRELLDSKHGDDKRKAELIARVVAAPKVPEQ